MTYREKNLLFWTIVAVAALLILLATSCALLAGTPIVDVAEEIVEILPQF